MGPHLTPTKKARIWQYHSDGQSNRQIATKLGWDRRTINRTINLMKEYPNPYYITPRPGRPRSLTPGDIAFAKLSLKRGQTRDGADIQRELFPNTGASTVRRALAMAGLHGRVRRKKPYLFKCHISARRKWANEFRTWDLQKWKSVWFSDESKFNLFGSDGKLYCRRGPGEEFEARNVRGMVKHGGGNIQVWGVLSWNGPGRLYRVEGTMDRWQLITILENGLLRSLDDAHTDPTQIIFAQDNDPKHKAKAVTAWFNNQNITLLPWPPSSPDMNIIEHAWDCVDRRLHHRGVLPTNTDQLWEILQDEWGKLNIDFIHNLYRSLPDRVSALHKAHGRHTRY